MTFRTKSFLLMSRTLPLPARARIIIEVPLYQEISQNAYPSTARIELDEVWSPLR